jgi:hypothetical protein
VTLANCLNILVTADFLKLEAVYDAVWNFFFKLNFVEVVNSCSLNLSNICPKVVLDIA